MHSYDGTIKWDAVLVCRKRDECLDEDSGQVIVPAEAVERAADAVNGYVTCLAHARTVGFNEPDRLNLFRAFVVSEARVGEPTTGWTTLKAALAATPERSRLEGAADG